MSWLFGYDIFMTFQLHDFISGNIRCSNVTLDIMITSSNGNIFRVTCPLCGNSPVTGEFTSQRPMTRSFVVFLISAWTNGWVNNRDPGDLKHHCTHYGVIVMMLERYWSPFFETSTNFIQREIVFFYCFTSCLTIQYLIFVYLIFMSLIVLYFPHSISVLSFYIDVDLPLSIG